jgi:hypothetical protein
MIFINYLVLKAKINQWEKNKKKIIVTFKA